jgi:hypothetical protein
MADTVIDCDAYPGCTGARKDLSGNNAREVDECDTNRVLRDL